MGFGEKTPTYLHFAVQGKRPPPQKRTGAITQDHGSHSSTDNSGVFPLPEFALLSLNFLWNSDLAASKLSKEETLRRLWKLPPGRDRKKPQAEYDPRGPTKGGSCFGDECCRVGSASRLGLRSFSRRDSVSDCTQFSLGDVFKSLKIKESPPGFKTARRKRFIRRNPRVLGGKERGAGGGKRRSRGLGSDAVPEVTSSRDQDLLCGGVTESWGLGSSYQLLGEAGRPRGGLRDAAQLGSRPEREREEDTLGIGLPGVPALPRAFPRRPYVPHVDLPFSTKGKGSGHHWGSVPGVLCWCLWERTCSAPEGTGGAAGLANLALCGPLSPTATLGHR